jgi:hypothetical protein
MIDANLPLRLSDIAEDSAFSMADVAFISGLEESTIYRLWDKPDWLDKISGRSLQALIATVPDLGEYVARFSVLSRRRKLIQSLATEGLVVSESAIVRCVTEGIPEPYLSAALQAAMHIMRGEGSKASSYLARFWGTGQDRALTALFSSNADTGLLINPDQLIAASDELALYAHSKNYSFHAIITQAVFGHYIGKATGHVSPSALPKVIDRQTAFTHRSSVMGLLINHNDRDLAERYSRLVAVTPVLKTVEEWSFPTYTRDTRPNADFTLPGSLLLRNTASEILNEINSDDYGDAYIYYLAKVYLPIALARDNTFGLRNNELLRTLIDQADKSDDTSIRGACQAVARLIRGPTR